MMHFPPVAAVLRVSQLMMSPASSLWNVWISRSMLARPGCLAGAPQCTYNRCRRMTVMIGSLSGRVVRYDVNWASVSAMSWTGSSRRRTKHVALLVLASLAVGDVALNSEVQHGQVFDRVSLRIQSSNQPETCSIMEVQAESV